jgi:hypothetical protein
MHRQRHPALLIALFFGLAGLAPEAWAYLDPSTGSMILSAIVGLFATIGLAVKTYWYKFRNLVMRRPGATRAAERHADTATQRAAAGPYKTGQRAAESDPPS